MPTVRLVVSTTKRLAPLVSEALFDAGAGGIEERASRGATLVAYAETRAALGAIWKRAQNSLKAALPAASLPTASIEVDAAETWRSAWMEHLRPVQLTPSIVLAPTTVVAPPLGAKQTMIVYQPALAFGDGDHPTTRLAARAIEAHYRGAAGGALLDIGAGTGVLSFVALHSGARRALGTDIDAEAVRAAETNAALNGLSRRARFVLSSARISGSFDLAVINIELRPLLQVLNSLPAVARRVPKLLVTGFLSSQVSEVKAAVKAAGFEPSTPKSEADWRLLSAKRG
jgi:ribosomal protein L11 methyltransferase